MKKLLLVLASFIIAVSLCAMPPRHNGPPLELSFSMKTVLENAANVNNTGSFLPLNGDLRALVSGLGTFSSFTYFPNTGSTFGSGTAGYLGSGMTISTDSNGVVTLTATGAGPGLAWSMEVKTIDGKKAIVLKTLVNNGSGAVTYELIVPPEWLGVDAEDAAYNAVTGRYHPDTVQGLLDSSILVFGAGPGNLWLMIYTVRLGELTFWD